MCHFFLAVKITKACLKGWGRVIAAVVTHKGITCGCEGEDGFNGQKRIGLDENIGVIYSYGPFTACTSFMLQHMQYVIAFFLVFFVIFNTQARQCQIYPQFTC